MMLLGRGPDARDNQTRQIQDALSNVEKHFGELCQIFAGYVRKTARLRDKADLLVNEIYAYAATETPNLKVGLKNFADEFSRLQDYRQAEVDRLEAKVVEPLKCYGSIVKLKRDDLKATLTAKNREAKQLSQLEKTRQRNPSDLHIISQAENELQRATLDATRTTRHLEETIDHFEKQKIRDIKNIFSEFITIEMLFHGKALEILTAAYQNIQNIDENEDLEVRVIEICFSVYFLYKYSFHSWARPVPHRKTQQIFQVPRTNSCIPSLFFALLQQKHAVLVKQGHCFCSKSPLQRTGSLKSSLRTAQQISRRMLRKDEEEDEEEDEDDEEEDEEDEFDATKEAFMRFR
ncbi:protein FAM92A [Cyanistes caeruleus]|uniref:protein FAM92A n=1 Tax=Cyanistes caeruleus TaxID=156563 RepID=UPI000CDB5223|nr:protein FAM92A [Cyanistes caeruleus]